MPLSLLHHTALTGGNGTLGSITSQTVPHSPSTCYEALMREILNSICAITGIFVWCKG